MCSSDLRVAKVRRQCATGEAREIRIKTGASLAEVGAAIGTGKSTIFRWENGQRTPTGDRAIAYSELLDALAVQGAS